MRQQYSVDKYDDRTSVASPAFEMDSRSYFYPSYSCLARAISFVLFILCSLGFPVFFFLFEYLIIIPLYPILLFYFIIIFLVFVLADQGPSPFTATINASSILACLLHSPRGPCCFAVSA